MAAVDTVRAEVVEAGLVEAGVVEVEVVVVEVEVVVVVPACVEAVLARVAFDPRTLFGRGTAITC